MSVIGIDFGNESCFVATAKSGGIETLANDYSQRATPTCVAFAGKKRIIGVAAKSQQVTNMKDTISNFKRILGKKYHDPHIAKELNSAPYRIEQKSDGSVGIRVKYLEQDHVFSPEQIAAMVFTKLKETSTVAIQTQVKDCVITVPVFATNADRKALLDAATIAGLNVLRCMNETTAIALSYGFYKTDLPAVEEKSRNIIFVDFGHSSLQVSACAFNKGKLKMICSTWDEIGGRDFDEVLADYFAKEFNSKYKVNAKNNARAYLRLLTEVEKLKKQMSANSTKLPLNIECFMDDIDVHSSLSRAEMEELSNSLLIRTEQTFRKCLHDSKLSLDDIYAVEVVGGSTRIPAVKDLISKIFVHPVSTTLNQDEAVSRGAALQCAILAPAVRVRDFSVMDMQNYAVNIKWEGDDKSDLEAFPVYHTTPFSRMLTLYKREPFKMQLYYRDHELQTNPVIGQWYVKDIKPTLTGEAQEVKVKVRIDHNGMVFIASASMIDKSDSMIADNETVSENTQNPEDNGQETTETQTDNTDEMKKQDKKKKTTTKMIELQMDSTTVGYNTAELQDYYQQEIKMIRNDEDEKRRVDARNELEEYIYDLREKLQTDGPMSMYVVEDERNSISNQLNNLAMWLYEDGEDCEGDVYRSKLGEMHLRTDPIKTRCQEYENQSAAFNELGHGIQMARKHVQEYRNGNTKYDHLTEAEMLNIADAADNALKWLDEYENKCSRNPRTIDPPVKVLDIRHELQTLNTCVNSVINRPKPKPQTPPIPTQDQQQPNVNQHSSSKPSADQSDADNGMEVD